MSVDQGFLRVDRRARRIPAGFLALSILGVAFIAFATLCPIGLRPHFAGANQERFGAYFVLGGVLAMTFRRQWLQVTLGVVLLAITLEAAQLLIPGRDGRLTDATIKALGGLMGSGAGYWVYPARRALQRLTQVAPEAALAPIRRD